MPYKDPQKAKEAKARWWRAFRDAHPTYHRDQMRSWRLQRYGRTERYLVCPEVFETPEQEIEFLAKEQARDDKKIMVKHNISYDTVFVPRTLVEHNRMTIYDSEYMK